MLQSWTLFLVSALYVALLFGIAWIGDRRAQLLGAPARKPWTYSLALGVYCTSWTFYGAVGRAASSGWDFLPIYLGPMLVFVFGWRLIGRIVAISKRHNITSIADFIGARYGRHQKLAMLVTFIAIFGVLPYIALQLKAVAFSFEVLSGSSIRSPGADNALLIALLLAAFSILFGTRQVVSSENHHGMMLAIAFESMCKLLAFLAVGLFVVYGIFDGFGDAYRAALSLPQVAETVMQPAWQTGFLTQTLLAAVAILCLPRQFHVTVVENTAASDLRKARWIFPLYLLLISLFVLPITAAGLRLMPLASADADTFVLAIPLSQDRPWLALAAYLGGFSAATSMVIVASIALSTMLCNEIVMPLLFRWQRLRLHERQDLSALLKAIRRVAILGIVMLAYLYYRLFTGPGSLTSIGLLSFAAVAQFAPSLIGGVYWKRATYEGAIAGLLIGFLLWCYTLLLPALLSATPETARLLLQGPLGIAWLRPEALFGVDHLDALTHGTLWSLGGNILGYIVFSLLATPGLRERLHATRFLEEPAEHPPTPLSPPKSSATVGDLQTLLERFFGFDRARELIADYAARQQRALPSPHDRADPGLARHTEHLLAGALGTSSARLVLASTLRGRDMQLEDVILLLDETSHAIQFNRELLRATLEHLSQGVSVVDKDLRLVAWNQRYITLFDYPPRLVEVGRPIEEVVRYNADRGLLGEGASDEQVARRIEHMRAGHAYTHQRELPDGSVIEIRGNPMPGGGFVTSYSDVTDYKLSERALQDVNETLESRVAQRTRELQDAMAEAERANDAKTRFLATASHDLVQPLNAARLFVSSLDRHALPKATTVLIGQVENSLLAAETLLSGLLDISRLDAHAQEMRLEHFELSQMLEPLASEFRALAQEHGLEFRFSVCRQVVESDPRLLRRVLQNFLSNAIRYTRSGRILLGCRHENGRLRIEVWDTGPGIAVDKQREIFEEFRRLNLQDARGERGLGLGLAIADRIARLLRHPLKLRSWPGRGSVFSVSVPLGKRASIQPAAVEAPRQGMAQLAGVRVLCLENEPAVLAGMQALLGGWGCEVIDARDERAAREHWLRTAKIPDLMLIDYHLDDGVNGVRVAQTLRALYGKAVPGIVITADHTQAARAEATAHDYALLPKPVKPAALRALMSGLLRQRDQG